MRKTRFRIGGIAACMILAASFALPVATISLSPAYAQINPGGNIGSQVTNAISSGQATGTIASGLNGIGGMSTAQWTTVIDNIRNGNANLANAVSLINAAAGGSLPPALTLGLSALDLGNMTPAQLQSFLSDPAIANAINAIAGGQGAIISAALGIAVNPQQLTPQAIQQLTTWLQGLGLGATAAQILANAAAIAAALGGGGIPPGNGGQQAISPGNPVDMTNANSGCNCQICNVQIPNHYGYVRSHTQAEFQRHRSWLVNTFWLENMLPALQMMASQLTAVGVAQIQMIGAMLDAKHQLETQRIFQQLTAQAHKDYQPSEGMCTFGTTVRSLANSERRSNLAQLAFAQRMNQRQTLNGEVLSREGLDSDKRSRLQHFISNYCDVSDNANGLSRLCQTAPPVPGRRNIDVDYTRNIESRLTLDVDFTAPGSAAATNDEQDVFALAANLFANNVASAAEPENLAVPDGRVRLSNVEKYMDLRAIFAKRSVAQNSFAAITAQRTAGSPDSAPYTKAVLREMGIVEDAEINALLGENPSYFAQMEILTKKLYQNPVFYTELYDKPVNVERKGAAMQAIGLMQDRDLYNSLLRSEVVLSVLLETMLQKEQDKVMNEGPKRNPSAGAR